MHRRAWSASQSRPSLRDSGANHTEQADDYQVGSRSALRQLFKALHQHLSGLRHEDSQC
jgi:hypothetical protein